MLRIIIETEVKEPPVLHPRTMHAIERAVKRGCIFLSTKVEGWESRVNLEKLSTNSSVNCVLAQVYSTFYMYAMERASLTKLEAVYYGFQTPTSYDGDLSAWYSYATKVWKEAIQARLG